MSGAKAACRPPASVQTRRRTGRRAVDQWLQPQGGYGYLVDYGIEKLLRHPRVHQVLEGTNEIMRLIVARQFLAKA